MLFSDMLSCENTKGTAIATAHDQLSFEQFDSAVAGFAAHLHSLGLQKGDRVALWGYNSSNWLVAFFAIVRAGGVAVLLNYSMDIPDAAELLRRTETRFIVCGDNGQTKRREDAPAALAEAAQVVPEHCIDVRRGVCSLAEEYAGKPGLPEQRSADEAGDTAFIIFTSGTTSTPKAVCISQRALTTDARALAAGLEGTLGPRMCVAVPLFHILGLLTSYVYLMNGSTVCLPESYRADELSSLIERFETSDMAAVAAVYQGLADSESFEDAVVPQLRTCLIAGGLSTPVQMMRMELNFANATFINMYGLSEGAPLTMVRPGDLVELRASTVGRATEGVSLRIVSTEGAELPCGEVGEVQASGACLMNGYEHLPAEEQAVDADGWLHTGDLGYLDEDGYLHLAGRLKDVIIRGGENIAPSEVEAALTDLDGIRDAKVMGAPHPIFGESVEACVRMDAGSPFDAGRILEGLRAKLPRYKVPAHIFDFDAFPLNVNGKLDQRALYANMIGRLRTLQVGEELSDGITVFDVTVKNSAYAIEPVTALVRHLAANIGYDRRRAARICLAVEEMLTERIMDAYSGAGDIRVRTILMPDWLRVAFADDGAEYVIDKRRDSSMSAKIILGSVDDFHTEWRDGKPIYCMDFLYDEYLDVKSFLLKGDGDVS